MERRVLKISITGEKSVRIDNILPILVEGSENYVYMETRIKVDNSSILAQNFSQEFIFNQNTSVIVDDVSDFEVIEDNGEYWVKTEIEVPEEVLVSPGFVLAINYQFEAIANTTTLVTTNYLVFLVLNQGTQYPALISSEDNYIDARLALENSEIAAANAEQALELVEQLSGTVQNLSVTITQTVNKLNEFIDSLQLDWAKSRNIYVISGDTEINPDYEGRTAEEPVTMAKAIKILNSGTATEYNLTMMETAIYEVPNNIAVIIAGTPHFFNYQTGIANDGTPIYSVPTLKFMRQSTDNSAVRFYSGRVHIEGAKVQKANNPSEYRIYPIKIDTDYGYWYCEGCAVYCQQVEFLTPVQFLSSQLQLTNCIFTDHGTRNNNGELTPIIDGVMKDRRRSYQLAIGECIGYIQGFCLFKGQRPDQGNGDAAITPMYIRHSKITFLPQLYMQYQSSTYENILKSNDNSVIYVAYSDMFISNTALPIYGTGWSYLADENNNLLGYSTTAPSGQYSYDFLLRARRSSINTIRSFFRELNANNQPKNKYLGKQSSIMSDGIQLNPDTLNLDYPWAVAYGYVSNTNRIQFTLPLSSPVSNRLFYPVLSFSTTGNSDSVRTDTALWIRGNIGLIQGFDKQFPITSEGKVVIENHQNVSSSYIPCATRFYNDQIWCTLYDCIPTALTSQVNNTPLTLSFRDLRINWSSHVRVERATTMYTDSSASSTVVTEVPQYGMVTLIDYKDDNYTEVTYTTNGTTYSGYIPVIALPD